MRYIVFFIVCIALIGQGVAAQIRASDSIRADLRYDKIWSFTDLYTQELQLLDTSLHQFQRFNPAHRGLFEQFSLGGNPGQAHGYRVFEYERPLGFQLGWKQYQRYQIQADSVRYFYTQYPASDLRYMIGPSSEQQASVLFSVPLSRQINVTADYRRVIAPGVFLQQNANIHTFSGSFRYFTPNNRYQLLAYYLANKADNSHSGGYQSEVYFRNEWLNLITDTLATPRTIIEPHLTTAKSTLSQRRFFAQQTYSIGKLYDFPRYVNDTLAPQFSTYRLGYRASYERQRYDYTDTSPTTDFYPTNLFNTTQVKDSLTARVLDNEGFLAIYGRRMRTDSLGFQHTFSLRAGVKHQYIWLDQVAITDTIYNDVDSTFVGENQLRRLQSMLLVLHLENQSQAKMSFWGDAQYALWGFNAADLSLQGRLRWNISNKIGWLAGKAVLQSVTPDYIVMRYVSTYRNWQHDSWQKINAVQLSATFYQPFLQLQLGYANHTFDNYVVWQNDGTPMQLSDVLVNISQVWGSKHFRFGDFHADNLLALQVSSSSQVPLPLLYGRHSLYWEKVLFSRAARVRLGLDVGYNSNYYAPGFMPDVGQFVVQNTEQLRFYPVIDVFLAAKVKRLRLFVNVHHVNQGLFRQKSYFSAYQYPAADRALRFGVSWMFFD